MEFFNLHDPSAFPPGAVIRQEAAPAFHRLRPPPIYTGGPAPREFAAWYFADGEAPPASLFTVKNLTLSGDQVLTLQEQFLTLPQNGIHAGAITGHNPDLRLRPIAGERVLLTGPAYQMYGHWLVDFCPRLHVLTALGLDLTRQRFLLPNSLMPFSVQWMNLLGITADQMEFYNPLTERPHIETALIPTTLRGNGRASPLFAAAMMDFKRRILGEAPAEGHRKVFVSRRGWKNHGRRLVNIEAIERIFETSGFEIVFPEQLAVRDQINLFANAKIIAGEYGSALHNAIFAPAGALSIALRGTLGHPGFLHSGFAKPLTNLARMYSVKPKCSPGIRCTALCRTTCIYAWICSTHSAAPNNLKNQRFFL